MTVKLVTVPNVPIVSTGTYQLATGETTFSAEDLADAVRAAQDPTIVSPRLKLGHNDTRFDEAIASGELGGEPAFGTVENLRLSDDAQTIIGDYCNIPDWLAASLPSSYPGRSIEGGWNFTAASGHTYRLVITACALLGVVWPGVTSLDDLREVLEQNGEAPEAIAADGGEFQGGRAERFVVARLIRPGDQAPARETQPADVTAGMDLGSIRMAFCGDLDDGEVPTVPETQPGGDDVGNQLWWWPRSIRVEDDGTLCLIVDDDEGHLIQIPFTVQQDDLIYGDPQLVIETYVPVTSDPDDVQAEGPRVLASWPVRAASRPSTTQQEVTTMDVDAAVLRTRLGLAEDADEAAIQAALEAAPEETHETDTAPTTSVPEGMVLVDAEQWESTRSGAEQGQQVAARLARQDRDAIIQAAIQDGKFPVSRRSHYEAMWDRDAEGAHHLLTASVEDGGLAKGLVPVRNEELGGAGGDGEQGQNAVAEHEAFMERHFPQAAARLRGTDRRVRVRQEA